MRYRKITKVLSRGDLSPFDNIDFKVLLECGHETTATFHYGERVIGRRKKCLYCAISSRNESNP